jgi:hypothetical protein
MDDRWMGMKQLNKAGFPNPALPLGTTGPCLMLRGHDTFIASREATGILGQE